MIAIPLSPREQMASIGFIIYFVGFMIAMGSRSMVGIYYTVVSAFPVGFACYLVPCIMSLLFPIPEMKPITRWDMMFHIGLTFLLIAPWSFAIANYDVFVWCFGVSEVIGTILTTASFYFIDIYDFENKYPSIMTVDRWIPIPPRVSVSYIPHGEYLRALVLMGIYVGTLGSWLFAFVSLTAGGICVILSAFIVCGGLFAGRSAWIIDHLRRFTNSSPPSNSSSILPTTTSYGAAMSKPHFG